MKKLILRFYFTQEALLKPLIISNYNTVLKRIHNFSFTFFFIFYGVEHEILKNTFKILFMTYKY